MSHYTTSLDIFFTFPPGWSANKRVGKVTRLSYPTRGSGLRAPAGPRRSAPAAPKIDTDFQFCAFWNSLPKCELEVMNRCNAYSLCACLS